MYPADADKDGYGNPDEPVRSCDDQPPDGFVDDAGDCDDADSRVNPAASQVCDSYDDDCDGLVDGDDADLSGGAVYYADTDDDGYGDPAVTAPGCWAGPEGFVDDDTDCDDADAATSPAATELCNGYDDDCDDLVDSADPTVADEGMTWFDSDGDGYGDAATSETASVGGGRVALPGDCDDTDPAVNPDALEVCDELDDDRDALEGGTPLAGGRRRRPPARRTWSVVVRAEALVVTKKIDAWPPAAHAADGVHSL